MPGGAIPINSSRGASLKARILRAGTWALIGYAVSQAVRLGGNLVMTRLLAPEMFGVMAIAVALMVILTMLSDIGLNQNIVQSRRGEDPAFLDTAWVVQIVRGFLLWLIVLALSVVLHGANVHGMVPSQSAYAYPGLPIVIAISSLSLIINSFQSTSIATAYRTLDQRRLVQIELASQITGLIAMIAVGLATRSIWALVAGVIAAASARTVLSHTWMDGHGNRWRLEPTALREVFGFGKWIFVSSAVGVIAAQGDRLLLGGFVDARMLGLYAIAILVIGVVEAGLYRLFVTISLPALSEVARNDPSRLRGAYNRLRLPVDLLLLFVAGLLFAAGRPVIELLYDPRYAAAGDMLQVLALSLFAARYGIAQQVYLAVGKPQYLALLNVVRLVSLYGLVFPLLYFSGVQAAIWGIALHGLAAVPFIYRFNARLGLTDVRGEATGLLALPLGYGCGELLHFLLAGVNAG